MQEQALEFQDSQDYISETLSQNKNFFSRFFSVVLERPMQADLCEFKVSWGFIQSPSKNNRFLMCWGSSSRTWAHHTSATLLVCITSLCYLETWVSLCGPDWPWTCISLPQPGTTGYISPWFLVVVPRVLEKQMSWAHILALRQQ